MEVSTSESRALELIDALAEIPVSELVQCARENLKATKITRTTRGQKDPETGERLPDTVSEPDYVTRQKALEWISAQRGASAVAPRKPVEPKQDKGSVQPVPGELVPKPGRGKA